MNYHEKTPVFGHANRHKSRFGGTGMIRVRERGREHIGKHCRSFVKIDLVLLEIGSGFLWIPIEIHTVIIQFRPTPRWLNGRIRRSVLGAPHTPASAISAAGASCNKSKNACVARLNFFRRR